MYILWCTSIYNVYHGISKNQTENKDTGERCHVNWRKVSCELEKGVMWTGERCHVNWRKVSCELEEGVMWTGTFTGFLTGTLASSGHYIPVHTSTYVVYSSTYQYIPIDEMMYLLILVHTTWYSSTPLRSSRYRVTHQGAYGGSWGHQAVRTIPGTVSLCGSCREHGGPGPPFPTFSGW